jgi:hypothetical protein
MVHCASFWREHNSVSQAGSAEREPDAEAYSGPCDFAANSLERGASSARSRLPDICAKDKEALDRCSMSRGGDRSNVDNVRDADERPQGNSAARAIRHLRAAPLTHSQLNAPRRRPVLRPYPARSPGIDPPRANLPERLPEYLRASAPAPLPETAAGTARPRGRADFIEVATVQVERQHECTAAELAQNRRTSPNRPLTGRPRR